MHPSVALLITVVMVLANAFFVAAEFAFVKIRPTRLQQLAREGHLRARLLLSITAQLPAYLSASQLGITLTSLTLGWLGEPAFAALIRPWLHGWSTSETTVHTLAVAASLTIITFLHTVLGELAPKALAICAISAVILLGSIPATLGAAPP
jgi:CBS domain containing-hemolysin-like protein